MSSLPPLRQHRKSTVETTPTMNKHNPSTSSYQTSKTVPLKQQSQQQLSSSISGGNPNNPNTNPSPSTFIPRRQRQQILPTITEDDLPIMRDRLTALRYNRPDESTSPRHKFGSNYDQIITMLRFTNPECEKDCLLRNMSEEVEVLRKENARLMTELRVAEAKERELEFECSLLRSTISVMGK
eukprot:PhF_6_TR37803/c0_g1_i1/m.56283